MPAPSVQWKETLYTAAVFDIRILHNGIFHLRRYLFSVLAAEASPYYIDVFNPDMGGEFCEHLLVRCRPFICDTYLTLVWEVVYLVDNRFSGTQAFP